MKKKVFAVILAAAAICGSLSPVYAADSELVLYTWEGMFPQEVLDGFEEETGCKIVYSNFDSGADGVGSDYRTAEWSADEGSA